jgi:iron(III) transport system permease protein
VLTILIQLLGSGQHPVRTPVSSFSLSALLTKLLPMLLLLVGGLVVLPILAVLAAVLQWDVVNSQLLREMAQTVLPQYALTTAVLCLVVAIGVGVLGAATASAVVLFDFKGRRTLEWALLLPLAMPAYVVAYAYTDFLQYSGPAQSAIRAAFSIQGRVLPEIRSVGGAAVVFVFTLYPYVYLLTRAALSQNAAHLMEAARLMGTPLRRRILAIALPLARPAIVAGIALALMETLADYGVSSYFGIQTFTAGIYKAWLVLDSPIAAAQLATLLLLLVAGLLQMERHARRNSRYASSRGARANSAEAQPIALRGRHAWTAQALCTVPVLLGFVLPVLCMLRPLIQAWGQADTPLPWSGFAVWGFNSFKLAAVTAALATALALGLAFIVRRTPTRLTRSVVQVANMGYAVPGAVIVVGLLIPVGWLQAAQPSWGVGGWISTTTLGITWAYLVRFSAVALQSVQSGYSQVPISMDETARTLGAGGGAIWWRVHRPLLQRATVVAALLVFVDVMKELPATLVLRPFDHDTLAVVAYQLARDERLGEAALPALALVLVGLIPVVLLSRTLNKKG